MEQNLVDAKTHLVELEAERDDLEMRQAWATIKEKGLSVEEVQKLLAKQKTV